MAELLRITRVDTLEALLPLRERWNTLAAQNATNTIFQTWEWHVAWWRAFGAAQPGGAAAQLWVLLAEADGQLVGLAPLFLRRRRVLGRSRRVIEFLSADLFRPCDLIVDRARPDVGPALLDWLNERRNQWDLLLLVNIPTSSPTLALLAAHAVARDRRAAIRDLDCEPTRLMGDAQADLALTTSRNVRYANNRLRRAGRVEWKVWSDAEQILGYLDAFARFHIARWAVTDTPSEFTVPAFREFHRQLVLSFAPTGWLKLAALLLDDEPIALNLFFDYQRRLFLFECTYDVAHAASSPGTIANAETIRYAVANHIQEVNFGRGRESYKFDLANQTPMHCEARIWARRGSAYVDRWVMRGLDALARKPAWGALLRLVAQRHRPNTHS